MASIIGIAAFGAVAVLSALRWLRVAQREHYLPGSVSRFAIRWWRLPSNLFLGLFGAIALGAMAINPLLGLGAALAIGTGPLGLTLRGRSSSLSWTRRLKALGATTLGIWVLFNALATGVVSVTVDGFSPAESLVWACALSAVATPLLIDAALAVNAPIERRLAKTFINQARQALDTVRPTVVAITGSYGKTTVKNYVAHLLAETKRVVASPASFNNSAGLSRTVNEQLSPGTEVFVAEMGTYGAGEIRDLCSWVIPDVAVICSIGPVHLERMGSIEAIVQAKSEIVEKAPVVVLNADAFGLAALADRCESQGKQVIRFRLNEDKIVIDDDPIDVGDLEGGHPSNVACALSVIKALGLNPQDFLTRLNPLPVVAHRGSISVSEAGVTVIDDTYNSNPTGAQAALELLVKSGSEHGAKVVITPGMVELGKDGFEENAKFSRSATERATHMIIVGRTNRQALMAGASAATSAARAAVVAVDTRAEALTWVRANLSSGDTVLWENDLPDHFP